MIEMLGNLTIRPKSLKDYFVYGICYFVICWSVSFLFSVLLMVPKISKDGSVFRQDVCLEEAPAGRFDESTECVYYGDPIYYPVGKIIKKKLLTNGIVSFVIVLVPFLFFGRGRKVREAKMYKYLINAVNDNKITIKEASNYLFDYKHEEIDEYQVHRLVKGEDL